MSGKRSGRRRIHRPEPPRPPTYGTGSIRTSGSGASGAEGPGGPPGRRSGGAPRVGPRRRPSAAPVERSRPRPPERVGRAPAKPEVSAPRRPPGDLRPDGRHRARGAAGSGPVRFPRPPAGRRPVVREGSGRSASAGPVPRAHVRTGARADRTPGRAADSGAEHRRSAARPGGDQCRTPRTGQWPGPWSRKGAACVSFSCTKDSIPAAGTDGAREDHERRPHGRAAAGAGGGPERSAARAVTAGPPRVHVHLLMHLHMNTAMIRDS